MSGVNPVILIQMLRQYHNYETGKRTFRFSKNERLRVHRETDEEEMRRKSLLDPMVREQAEREIADILKKTLKDRVRGRVWIDPAMKKIAVPTQMSTGMNGYGVLPTGSRVDIPEGKFIRAFTYWEKVNDIDLSGFAMKENGERMEFSWRNMWRQQGDDIAFSGDQTSGYNGGSEYFDVNVDLFRVNHLGYRYLIFCDNIYSSGASFKSCFCKAGFMIREEDPKDIPCWNGEEKTNIMSEREKKQIFDPKTVATSFIVNPNSTFCYLFAIDLKEREMIWLNFARSDNRRVAGEENMDFLMPMLKETEMLNLYDLFEMMAENQITDKNKIGYADLIVSDREQQVCNFTADYLKEIEVIHSWDYDKILKYLNS